MGQQVVVVVHAVIGSKKDIDNLLDSIRVELEGNAAVPVSASEGSAEGQSLDVGIEVVDDASGERFTLSEFPDEILAVTARMMK